MANEAHDQLTYFFWLPADKDEFGFGRLADAPFTGTAFYRTDLERTIAEHIRDRVDRLRRSNELAAMTPAGDLVPVGGELSLRKLHFRFTYRVNNAALERALGGDQLDGTAIIFSNGLYMWSFDIPKRARQGTEDLKDVLIAFLKEDFVERHVRTLFDFQWNSGQSGHEYRGIMTYFQLDQLFNSIFDQYAHPHLFLDGRPEHLQKEAGKALGNGGRVRAEYDVEHLIKSLSLCGFERDYFPLFDRRKNYALSREYGDPLAYIDSSISVKDTHVPPADEDLLHRREMFFSRLAFAGMEQFLRVSASFGLNLYRVGLDYVRAELANQNIEARQNRPSGELRRPSLAGSNVTVGDLEAYYALLASKLPRLRFLGDLIDGLCVDSRPAREVKPNGIEGAVEWTEAKGTLTEAQGQFRRQVDAVEADLRTIESSLLTVRSELTLAELTEARKLAEIESEAPRSAVLKSVQWGQLTARLAVFAAIIAGGQLYSQIAVWITEQVYDPPGAALWWETLIVVLVWAVGLIVFVALIVYYGRAKSWNMNPDEEGAGSERPETHVFDYSSLLKQIEAAGGAGPVMDRTRTQMIHPEDVESHIGCVNFSTFREMPSSGVERVKYSLESAPSKNGLSYILDVEVDRRVGTDRAERLVGIRLVMRGEPGNTTADLLPSATHIIGTCIQSLVFPRASEGEIRAYFRTRFGWDWPTTQTGPLPT